MTYNISPVQPHRREETNRSEQTKPQGQPPNDNFRKSMRNRPHNKEDQHAGVEDREESPSLFDLSKSEKRKSKSHLNTSKSTKDSTSDLTPHRPITAKQSQKDQDSDSFESNRDSEALLNSETPQPTVDDQFYTTTKEQPPRIEEGFQEATETPQPLLPGEIKKPMDQAQQPELQTMEALKHAQAAAALKQSQKMKRSDEESSFETHPLDKTSKKSKTGKSEDVRSEKGSEVKGEGAIAVNSSIQAAAFHTEKTEKAEEIIPSVTIQELADRILVMRKENETQTTITLHHPPLLKDATITLTASDHAKREFNISFANLSPDAKSMLDQRLKEDALTQRLENRGMIVHMLTTSTQPENLIPTDTGQAFRDQQDQQQQQQRRQNFQNMEEGEEEIT